ncbi:hypothetical protein PRVXH_000815 [Proteinivorax hydrogeniformans]|uniref:Methyl-accepting chemotaxis protein n=1 Tax=Proteinivorax hydrogeniformans TaxID=1826727 RepID=A0AAU8HVW1_9FIRM
MKLMESMLLRWSLFCIIILAITSTLFFGVTYLFQSDYIQARELALNEKSRDNIATMSNYIAAIHDEINQIVGYGNYEIYEDNKAAVWNDLNEEMNEKLTVPIKKLKEKSDYKSMQTDLETAKKLLTYATKKRDVQGLIDAHRIIHDLDYFVFQGRTNKKYFAVTKTLEGQVRHEVNIQR